MAGFLCSAPALAQEYFPLQVGNQWDFESTLDPPNRLLVTVGASAISVGGITGEWFLVDGLPMPFDTVRVDQHRLEGLDHGLSRVVLDFDALPGSTYSLPVRFDAATVDTMTVKVGRQTILTPAGYFSAKTFEATSHTVADRGWTMAVAREVGPVRVVDNQGTWSTLVSAILGGSPYPWIVAELQADRATYSLGEPIELTLRLTNTDVITHKISSDCNSVAYEINEIAPASGPCVTWTWLVDFPPGSWREWTWTHDPHIMGLNGPGDDQGVFAHFGTAWDSLSVSAPPFEGGWVQAWIDASMNDSALEAIRSDLQAEVLESRISPNGNRWETWALAGITIEEAVDRYVNHPGILLESARYMYLTNATSVAATPEHTVPQIMSVYPNPADQKITLTLPTPTGTVTVFDILGRLKWQQTAAHQATLETANWPPGVYLFVAQGRDQVIRGTFVVSR